MENNPKLEQFLFTHEETLKMLLRQKALEVLLLVKAADLPYTDENIIRAVPLLEPREGDLFDNHRSDLISESLHLASSLENLAAAARRAAAPE